MDRKEAIRKYKETATPMGVFCVRHNATGKAYIGTSPNLPAVLNRERFQLKNGVHRVRDLQADWNTFGEDAFSVEILDTLEPKDPPGDVQNDLKELERMWQEKLAPTGLYR